MRAGVTAVLVVVLGLALGSFLNVVRYRLPRGKSVAGGRSACPGCGHTIAWYDNIPLVSFLVLARKCRHCGWKIPWIYPIVEFATALACLGVWLVFPARQTPAYFVLTALLVASAGIDYDLRIIPDKLTLPGIALGVIFSLTLLAGPGEPLTGSLVGAVLGILVGGGSLAAIALAYRAVRKVEGMGGGDIKLMAMVGAFLGWKLALVTIFLGAFVGGVVGIVVACKSAQRFKTAVPFGVFLAPAAVVAMLWGDALVDEYIKTISQ